MDDNQQKQVFKDEQTQKELNAPLQDGGVRSGEYREFLQMLMKMIESGKIDEMKPSTLINSEVYDKLDELTQGKVDLEAVNLTSAVREIKGLYEAGFSESYQMENLVMRLKYTKERLETEGGDLFII